jgi:hypothetical protein
MPIMTEKPATIPQPLTGVEIRQGIATRMTKELPEEAREKWRDDIAERLSKVCSLTPAAAYAKFSATWHLEWWLTKDTVMASWWVRGTLDDYGRQTPFYMDLIWEGTPDDSVMLDGEIPFTPPDKFRRETDQPIPKPVELKGQEPEKGSFSRAAKGDGKRRMV